jgi:hypothetical protein
MVTCRGLSDTMPKLGLPEVSGDQNNLVEFTVVVEIV